MYRAHLKVASGPCRMAMIAIIVTLALLVVPQPTLGEGLPVIDFVSPGGVVSDLYVLNVTVIGDLAPGEVYYGVDTAEPGIPMTSTGNYHFEAVIDTSGIPEGDHTIRVMAFNTTGVNVTKDQTITVDHTAPVVVITSSVPEHVIGDYTVTATVEDTNVDASRVMLILDGNLSDPRQMEDQGDHYAHTLNTSHDFVCGPHFISVQVFDLGNIEAWSENVTLQVDNCKPMVMFTSDGGHVKGIYELRVNVTDAYMDPASVWAVFDEDELNKTTLEYHGDGMYSYAFDTTTMPDGDHDIHILAIDLVGWTRYGGPLVIQVDNNPPTSRITSEGGNVSGYYTLTAVIDDAYLDSTAVYMVVDDDDATATAMVWAGDRYEVAIDTRNLEDGNRSIRVWATDLWGQDSRSQPLMLYVDNNVPYVRILTGGGERWANYRFRANVTDPHLDTACVKVKVGDADPVQMMFDESQLWYYDLDTTKFPEGPLTLSVFACDHRGNMNMGEESITIIISNRADLEITSVEWVSTEVEEGEMVKVQLTVRNNGHSTAKDFKVALISGGQELTYVMELTGIKPDKIHSYTLEWKAENRGERVVTLVVDPSDAIAEVDETNNGWRYETITITQEGSGIPGMGGVLLVLALLASAAPMRRRRCSRTS